MRNNLLNQVPQAFFSQSNNYLYKLRLFQSQLNILNYLDLFTNFILSILTLPKKIYDYKATEAAKNFNYIELISRKIKMESF